MCLSFLFKLLSTQSSSGSNDDFGSILSACSLQVSKSHAYYIVIGKTVS